MNHRLPYSSEITLSFDNAGLESEDNSSASLYTSSGSGSGYGTHTDGTHSRSQGNSESNSLDSESEHKSKISSGSAGYGSALNCSDQKEEESDGVAELAAYHNPYYIYHDIPLTPPRSPLSDRSTGHGTKSGSVTSKHQPLHAYTRQLNMFIGEEWENVHDGNYIERQAVSCPPSPRITQFPILRQPGKIVTTESKDSTAIQPEVIHSRRTHIPRDPLQYFFFHMSQEKPKVAKKYIINPNPYNDLNHKFHSALHCPCFLFFFFLCCLPGIHFMQKGDIEYKLGNEQRAKALGFRSSVLYCTGIIVGATFLSVSVFIAVQFVQGQVQAPQS